MQSNVSIRAAEAGDRAELQRLIHALFPDIPVADLDAEVDRYLGAATLVQAVFVAERMAGGLAGFIEVGTRPYAEGCESSPVPYIEAWFVDPDVRRQRIGASLFVAAEDWARALGFTEIASDVQVDNEVSIAAHRQLGYEETERLICFRRGL